LFLFLFSLCSPSFFFVSDDTPSRSDRTSHTTHHPLPVSSSTSSPTGDSLVSCTHNCSQMESRVRVVDQQIDSMRKEIEGTQNLIARKCEQMIDERIAHLRGTIEQEITDKIYLADRALHASELSRRAETIVTNASTLPQSSPRSSYSNSKSNGNINPILSQDWRLLKSELNIEIKKNIAAMQAIMEEKIR
jgi:hypothetical protein